jgi:hypothetical protein
MSTIRVMRLALLPLVLVLAVGCTRDAQPAPTVSVSASPDPTIDFIGLPSAPIGTPLTQLTEAGVVSTAQPGCGASFPAIPYATPVFAEDQLVLIWANPPLHTPENVMVGTPIEQARNRYPGAVVLTPTAGSHSYAGLLVSGPDGLAYLLLHDGTTVQKLLVGLERYARLLFDSGFGSC